MAVSDNSPLTVIPRMKVPSRKPTQHPCPAQHLETHTCPQHSLPCSPRPSSSGPRAGSPPDTLVLHNRVTDGPRPKLQAMKVGREGLAAQPVKTNGEAGLPPLPQASFQCKKRAHLAGYYGILESTEVSYFPRQLMSPCSAPCKLWCLKAFCEVDEAVPFLASLCIIVSILFVLLGLLACVITPHLSFQLSASSVLLIYFAAHGWKVLVYSPF